MIELFRQNLVRCAVFSRSFADPSKDYVHSPAGSLLVDEAENAGYRGLGILCQVGRSSEFLEKEDIERKEAERRGSLGATRPARRRDCMTDI